MAHAATRCSAILRLGVAGPRSVCDLILYLDPQGDKPPKKALHLSYPDGQCFVGGCFMPLQEGVLFPAQVVIGSEAVMVQQAGFGMRHTGKG